ncbi:MAG: hypothetical protein HC915_21685 [Anaerolineae bacterium]|nr:hypothetical protein [Anaerolineae bacterium]
MLQRPLRLTIALLSLLLAAGVSLVRSGRFTNIAGSFRMRQQTLGFTPCSVFWANFPKTDNLCLL